MNRQLPNVIGKIVMARPANHSRQAEQYLVLSQSDTHLGVVSIERPLSGMFVFGLGAWDVLMFLDGGDVAEQVLFNLNGLTNDPAYTFTEYGRANMKTTRLAVANLIEAQRATIRLFVPAEAACDEPPSPSLGDLPREVGHTLTFQGGRIEVFCDDPVELPARVQQITNLLSR